MAEGRCQVKEGHPWSRLGVVRLRVRLAGHGNDEPGAQKMNHRIVRVGKYLWRSSCAFVDMASHPVTGHH